MHLAVGPSGPAKCTFSPTTGVLERALTILGPRESKAGRDTRTRLRRFNSMGLCEGGNGQHCTFLASTSRKQLPHILQKLRYRGASAEVGVWRGDYSSMILSGWRSGGKHYLVDPFLAYGDGCPHGGRNLTEAKRKYQSGGQWHCRFEQSAFDAVYNRTSARFAAKAGSRAVFMRQFSAQAAAALGSSGEQLDAVYLDGRHDYAGMLEDLRSWVPLLCAGGVLAGHDYITGQGTEVCPALAHALAHAHTPPTLALAPTPLTRSRVRCATTSPARKAAPRSAVRGSSSRPTTRPRSSSSKAPRSVPRLVETRRRR